MQHSLGLGLWYEIEMTHKGFQCRSNIPSLELKQLDVATEAQAHNKIRDILVEIYKTGIQIFSKPYT